MHSLTCFFLVNLKTIIKFFDFAADYQRWDFGNFIVCTKNSCRNWIPCAICATIKLLFDKQIRDSKWRGPIWERQISINAKEMPRPSLIHSVRFDKKSVECWKYISSLISWSQFIVCRIGRPWRFLDDKQLGNCSARLQSMTKNLANAMIFLELPQWDMDGK